jgi:hypothetical protein
MTIRRSTRSSDLRLLLLLLLLLVVDLCVALFGDGSLRAVASWRQRLGVPANGTRRLAKDDPRQTFVR